MLQIIILRKNFIYFFIAASSNQMLNGQIESIDEQGILLSVHLCWKYTSLIQLYRNMGYIEMKYFCSEQHQIKSEIIFFKLSTRFLLGLKSF